VSRTAVLHTCAALIPKIGSQSGLGTIAFQFIQTFDQNFVLLAEHHYIQTPSDDSTAAFLSLLFKSKYEVSKSQWTKKIEQAHYL